jgi:hypothetical protein
MFRMAVAPGSGGFHDAAVIEALEPSLWLELFDAFGEPPGLDRAAATIEHISDRLGGTGLPELLQLALEWMYNLRSEDGAERLGDAAREFNIDLRAFKGVAPIELVARVALLAAKDANARKALDRAQTGALIASHPSSRVYEYRGRMEKSLERVEERLTEFRSRISPWLDERGLGDRVELSVRREESVTRIVIVRGKRMHAPVSFTPSGRRPLPHRPIHCDLLVYDDGTDLLSIHAPANLVDGYRRFAGEIFWGDPEHLVESPCSLEPLKEGPALLDRHGSAEIRKVTLTSVRFRPHEGGTCDYWNEDVFELLRRLKVPVQEGEFVAARFQFAFYAGGGRPLTVEVKGATIKAVDGARRSIVLTALQRMSICRVQGDAVGPFFWDLAVGAHPRSMWRGLLDDSALDSLIGDGVLGSTKRASVAHVSAPAAGPVLDVTPTDDDVPFFGTSVDPDVPGRRLTHSDVEGLEVDGARLAARWASVLECPGTPREQVIAGLYDVGECAFGAKRLQLLLALRAPGNDLARLASSLPTGSVILAPRARSATPWPLPNVELESLVPDRATARRAIVRALKLESEVDARDRAQPQDTLIVDVPRHAIWLHAVEIRLSDSLFLFVELVAAATQGGGIASQEELTTKLSRKGAAENTARVAKGKAEKAMKSQLLAAGVTPPRALFLAIKGGYQYAGAAFVAA